MRFRDQIRPRQSTQYETYSGKTRKRSGLFRCILPISIPDKSAGSYKFEIEGRYKTYYDKIEKEIYFTIPFEGTLTYASGQIVNADIQLQNMETGKWFATSVNKGTGQYSLELLPGTYKLKLSSPEVKKITIKKLERIGSVAFDEITLCRV